VSGDAGFDELLAGHVEEAGLRPLVRYAELLEQWSRRHNLVRYTDRRELVERHLLEALAARRLLAAAGRLLDVGSGAGLPGVPLLACLPGWSGVLLEPRQKRWAFLRLVVRELELDVDVERARFQEYRGVGFDVIVSRAVGESSELIEWARDRLLPGGRVMLWTTAVELEVLERAAGWRVLSCALPGLERGRLVQMWPCFT
jgi:16S rRNA (guanine527-N7)-methyltransferase